MAIHLFRTHTRFPQPSWSAIRCVCVCCCIVCAACAGCAGSHHRKHCKVEMVSACLVWQRTWQRIHCRCVVSHRLEATQYCSISTSSTLLSDPLALRILEPCWWCSPGIILGSQWEWQRTSRSRIHGRPGSSTKVSVGPVMGPKTKQIGRIRDVLRLFTVSTCLRHCTLASHHNFHHRYLSSLQ